MSRNTETGRKKEQKEERLPEIHTDEEFEERILWLLERRKAEKQRQITVSYTHLTLPTTSRV